jgi:deoxyribonuclease V
MAFGGRMELEKLKEEQKRLARKLVLADSFSEISTIAGCQIFYTTTDLIAVVVLLDYKTRVVIDKKFIVSKPKLPHIPFFSSYREIPSVVEAVSQLKQRPDAIMYPCDGILHPRKMGSASHLGLALDMPSIGVCKKLSFGELRGDEIFVGEEKRGAIVRTRDYAKPLHVSQGHKIGLESCLKIVRDLTKEGSKLPDPLRIAHNYGLFVKKSLCQNQRSPIKSGTEAESLQA